MSSNSPYCRRNRLSSCQSLSGPVEQLRNTKEDRLYLVARRSPKMVNEKSLARFVNVIRLSCALCTIIMFSSVTTM